MRKQEQQRTGRSKSDNWRGTRRAWRTPGGGGVRGLASTLADRGMWNVALLSLWVSSAWRPPPASMRRTAECGHVPIACRDPNDRFLNVNSILWLSPAPTAGRATHHEGLRGPNDQWPILQIPMAEQGVTRRVGPTADGRFLAWSFAIGIWSFPHYSRAVFANSAG